MNEELVRKVMSVAQRIQALSPCPDRPPKTIEQLAQEVEVAVKVYEQDQDWAEYRHANSAVSGVWCGIQFDKGEFYVGWGVDEYPEEPFSPKPTIREAVYEALRAMAEYHVEIEAQKAQLVEDSLE